MEQKLTTSAHKTIASTKAGTLADDLVSRLEKQVEDGSLQPGDRYPTEREITDRFGVSRTVVREAFARLAAQGLLVSRRGSGAFVSEHARFRPLQVSPEELTEIDDVLALLEVRAAVETEMAGLAALRRDADDLGAMTARIAAMDRATDTDESARIDRAFHTAIARATRNAHFLRFTEFLGARLVPARRIVFEEGGASSAQYLKLINDDHRAIFEAIARSDEAAARDAARRHMVASQARHAALRGRSVPAK